MPFPFFNVIKDCIHHLSWSTELTICKYIRLRVVENMFGILASRFRVPLGTMEPIPEVVRDIVYTCVVLYNMLRTHQGGADRAPSPAKYVEAVRNEHVVYVPDDNYRPTERLLQSCGGIGNARGQDLRCFIQQPCSRKNRHP